MFNFLNFNSIFFSPAYVVGNEYELSEKFSFQAMKDGQDWSPRLAIFGDMGNVNSRSLVRLEREADQGMYDAIIHLGKNLASTYSQN